MDYILIAVIVLGAIGLIAAIVLFAASRSLLSMRIHVLLRWANCCLEPTVVDADILVVVVWPTPL